MDFRVPPGLAELLQNFTVAVLRENPSDLFQFAADYFVNLNANRVQIKKPLTKGVSFGAGSDDEPMHTESSDEEPGELQYLPCD